MMFLQLDCGRSVAMSHFDYKRTYSELLMGSPNAELNNRIIERALTERDVTWGKRTTHIIPPKINNEDPAHPSLPPVLWRAWLICYQPVDPTFMASELVVLWFAEDQDDCPLRDIMQTALRGLDWERLARDFYW